MSLSTATIATDASMSLSFAEYLEIVVDILTFPVAIVLRIFSSANKQRTWARAIGDSGMRAIVASRWSARQMRYILGGTATPIYTKWAKRNKLQVLTDEIDESAKLHWVGPRRFDRVVLFLHGGGLSFPPSPNDHLDFFLKVQLDLEATIEGAGVVFLEYSLTPDYPLPIQLRQINAAMKYLISHGSQPASIILVGDSAGANLIMQLVSHIMHPLPNIPTPVSLSEPLGGALLISPWISFDTSSPSFVENDKKDCTNTYLLDYLANILRPGIPLDQRDYFEPYVADDEWWDGLDKVVSRILNTAGEVECLRDTILKFGETLKKHVKDTTIVVEKNGVHEDVLRDFGVGQGGKSDAYHLYIAWLSETFNGRH
ncbi:hypothetical protein EW146_g7648 [Bondarzewia mesenterica]|uniref:Alpha/beta hydrolase fold-3 domain-containing protein n=1 Tax=Bondarzewia mesenterica TaxID=1095465 RepID=A0A4S4LLZ3_9AGAM|nr:hypothetical protein EW146_g7648 [Bondarzewia mesenterica]